MRRPPHRVLGRVDRPVGARHHRHARRAHRLACVRLVAHRADLPAGGADEGDAAGLADLGEVRVLGEEAVAGVDGVGAGDLGGADDAGDVEVALRRGRGPMQTASSASRTWQRSRSASL